MTPITRRNQYNCSGSHGANELERHRQHELSLRFVAAVATCLLSPAELAQQGFGPGQRVLLDAHNAYPQNGRWTDRIDRALSTSLPVAIEQDLYWVKSPASGGFDIGVAHDSQSSIARRRSKRIFEKIRPIMEHALAEPSRDTWPLIVLNLDFKQNDAPLLDAVYTLLGKYEAWLTTAPRTLTPDVAAPLSVGPLLVCLDPAMRSARASTTPFPSGNVCAHSARFHRPPRPAPTPMSARRT